MRAVVTNCLVVMFLLLPVQFVYLPLRIAPSDVWVCLVLPVCWVWLVSLRQPLRLPYLPALLLILLAGTLASLLSANPAGGMAVALKEVYLYAWMVTMAAVFACAAPRDLRRVLLAWYAASCVNGALILAQFVHPPLLQLMSAGAARVGGTLDPFRPSGLLANSNAAAMFQLLALVPLVALRPPPRNFVPLAVLTAATIVGTGSMGAVLALLCGVAAGLVLLVAWARDLPAATSLVLRSALVGALVIGSFLVLTGGASDYDVRFQAMFLDRGTRSAESRFGIWDKGVHMLLADLPVVGIGPGRFRELEGDEMHNDLLSFAVERGPLGVLGLTLLGTLIVVRAVRVSRADRSPGGRWRIVFPAAIVAVLVESQTHEAFHIREAWMVLALQEAVLQASGAASGAGAGAGAEAVAARSGPQPSRPR